MSTASKLRGNSHAKWKVEDDYFLWVSRDKSIKELADHFRRTNGGISHRLQHLRDPKHAAHKRLFATYILAPVPSKIRCKEHHGKLALVAELKRRDIKLNIELKLDNKGEKWKQIDDDCLWTNRDVCYELLAKHHGRTVGAIRKRLELLAERRAIKSSSRLVSQAQGTPPVPATQPAAQALPTITKPTQLQPVPQGLRPRQRATQPAQQYNPYGQQYISYAPQPVYIPYGNLGAAPGYGFSSYGYAGNSSAQQSRKRPREQQPFSQHPDSKRRRLL